MFELFTDHAVKEEVREMLFALKEADYAISTLPKEEIEKYASQFGYIIKTRQLKSGKTKVRLAELEGKG